MKSSEVVLHPVRMRIVQAFLGGRELTTKNVRDEVSDVPTATLYRQVAALAAGGVLEVVEETRVRGAVERTYRLREGTTVVGADEAGEMSPEDHRQAFLTFVLGLAADFDRYLERGAADLGRDLVGFRRNAMHLSDAEMLELVADLRAVLQPRLDLPPAPGRTRRFIATIMMPDASSP